jgi:hypothetical protein
MSDNLEKRTKEARNEDPLSGAPGAHPVATGAGAVIGGIAGAAIGTAVAGPVGAVAGASMAAGALAGGLAGKYAGEAVDPTVEDAYWRENHSAQRYANEGPYEDFEPAYRTGYEGFTRHSGERFADVEEPLRSEYESKNSHQPWNKARHAAEAAWQRLQDRRDNKA